jgi:hypothetical protein
VARARHFALVGERVILPDSTTLLDYLLHKTSNLVDTMFVYPDRMRANLESTRGLVFSGQLLLDLVEHGVFARTLTVWCRLMPCAPGKKTWTSIWSVGPTPTTVHASCHATSASNI